MKCQIYLADALGGAFSAADVLRPEATLMFTIEKIRASRDVDVFRVTSDTFNFRMTIGRSEIVVERNGIVVAAPFDASVDGDWQVSAVWSPHKIGATAIPLREGPNPRFAWKQTPPVIAPRDVLKYAKELRLDSARKFLTTEDFRVAVHHSISDLIKDFENSGAHTAVWDKTYDGNRRIRVAPKREPEVHRLIEWHWQDWAELRGIRIMPEAQTAAGRLDFALLASIEKSGIETICVEFKYAHADDLEHGLEVQLPDYMARLQARYGVYVVLWFRGSEFSKPTTSRIQSIATRWQIPLKNKGDRQYLHHLLMARCLGPRNNIRCFLLDATAPPPASKK